MTCLGGPGRTLALPKAANPQGPDQPFGSGQVGLLKQGCIVDGLQEAGLAAG